MSAETLWKASALMRERATHPDISASPWFASPHGDVHDDGSLWVCDSQSGVAAEHIASWHPAVALAVADSLDAALEEWGDTVPLSSPMYAALLTVARAYLGEQP